nr:uncharacterized protein LOC127325898 [Lolium perenne]
MGIGTTTGNSNDDHDPYEAYEDSEKTPDSNSVGPELTLERAIEHARRQQNSPPRAAPPVSDHHCASTTAVRTPTSSTKETRRGSWAGRKPCRRSPSEEPTPFEETRKAPRRCLQQEHDTRALSPPDPQILGFHLEPLARRIPRLSHTTIGERHTVNSKAVSSRRSRHKSAATARSENLGLSPGARRRTRRSLNDAFKKGAASADVTVVARAGKGFPSANTPTFYTGNRSTKRLIRCHRALLAGHHVAPATMVSGQPLSHWHARQPKWLPPTRATAPAPNSAPCHTEKNEDFAVRAPDSNRGAGQPPHLAPPPPGGEHSQIGLQQPPWLPALTDLGRKWARKGPGAPAPARTQGGQIWQHHLTRTPPRRSGRAPQLPAEQLAGPGPTRAAITFTSPPWLELAPPRRSRSEEPRRHERAKEAPSPRRGRSSAPPRPPPGATPSPAAGAAPRPPREGVEGPATAGAARALPGDALWQRRGEGEKRRRVEEDTWKLYKKKIE